MESSDFNLSYSEVDSGINFQNDLLIQLQRALNNERVAPELLMYKEDLVDSISIQIKQRQQNLDETVLKSIDDTYLTQIYQMDIERCRYMLVSYLRVRIQKMEQYAMSIIRNREIKKRLSIKELNYLEHYVDNKGILLNNVICDLPDHYNKLNEDEMINDPNLNIYVYCRVLEDIHDFHPSQSDTVEDLKKENQYIVLYSDIRDYVYQDKVELF